jgi:cellulose synthase/poly-beta-1,6-N-acetylglucosamine synthase-like glycosyltransferase
MEDFQDVKGTPAVDVIIPVYGERSEGLAATLSGCLNQTYPVSQVYVIDDGSPSPVVLPGRAEATGRVHLLRLAENQGISAARNAGLAKSSAPLLWCINCEVIPAPEWLATCVDYLSAHPGVGSCCTRMVPQAPGRLLTRWRMRFMEARFGGASGTVAFAPGHSVLLRREAVERVGGYDPRFRRINEDSDLSKRMREAGWETHFVAGSFCTSIQEDTLRGLSHKLLLRSNWHSPDDYPLARVFLDQTRWFLARLARNIVKGRLLFWPIDVALWVGALKIATRRTLAARHERRQVGKEA